MHLVIIDPKTGKVVSAQIYDTYATSQQLDQFITSEYIPPGHVIAAACSDDMAHNLSDLAKHWFEMMGSREIRRLEYRCAFAFIGLSGEREASERRGRSKQGELSIVQAFEIDTNYVPAAESGFLQSIKQQETEFLENMGEIAQEDETIQQRTQNHENRKNRENEQ